LNEKHHRKYVSLRKANLEKRQFELSMRSGLSRATIYQILNRAEKCDSTTKKVNVCCLSQGGWRKIRFTVKGEFFVQEPNQLQDVEQRELYLLL
jgi:hypothetical protein